MGSKSNIYNNNKAPAAHGCGHFTPLVVVMVGLPAHGKSVLARTLAKYLNWSGHHTKVVSVKEQERDEDLGTNDMLAAAQIYTHQAATEAQAWVEIGGDIVILDGCHPRRELRQQLHMYFVKQMSYKLLFIENIIDDEKLLHQNKKETAQMSEEYIKKDFNDAMDDIENKIEQMSEIYEPISPKTESSLSYIKYHNAGENIEVHRLNGAYETKVLGFVSSFRSQRKTFYFSRHGESENNLLGKIGGDTSLSSRGQMYASLLADYFNKKEVIADLKVWTSDKLRTKQTASGIPVDQEHLEALNELDAGICEGLSYEEMAEMYPREFAWRDQDKLRYRYPWGESYLDIMARLAPVLLELERESNVLVVSHQAVLRCVLAYFLNTPLEKLPYLKIPLHSAIKLSSRGWDYDIEYIKFDVDCVDTYRPQPEDWKEEEKNGDQDQSDYSTPSESWLIKDTCG